MPRRPRDADNDDFNEGFESFDELEAEEHLEQLDPDADLDEIREIDFEDPNFIRGQAPWYGEDIDDLD